MLSSVNLSSNLKHAACREIKLEAHVRFNHALPNSNIKMVTNMATLIDLSTVEERNLEIKNERQKI